MKNKKLSTTVLFSTLLLFIYTSNCFSQSDNNSIVQDISKDTLSLSTPFYSGMNGYHAFRIPTVIQTKNTLIAFAEGRKNSTSDFGDIDIVYRRSTNQGKTWQPMQVLYDLDTMAVQNPVPIYVKKENKVVFLFNTTSMSEHDILNTDYELKDERMAYMTASSDEGKSWAPVQNITRSVKRKDWRWHAIGPVHGIELKHSANKGRLVVPIAMSIAKGNKAYCMALVYSDDSGNTWQIGAVDENLKDAVQANETTIAELPDGRIYINTRDQNGGSKEKNRGETFSLDGGLTFQEPIVESDKFPSPVVQAALLSWNGDKNQILFSTPSSKNKRENLVIMTSSDNVKTWNTLFKVHEGYSAYSDLVQMDENTLGVIYETDDYKKIRFKRISMK
ncbi:exo-alpha-sialidase [Aurantibacter crassamenti]|uniref:sialidase family protein n=1 Tax=Aurantibacter crassamenti TaxID=1837375 RepID=UPI00193A3D39|nr:sialidase family protein [Aurantibacter crassamenti]MBM1105415.1 exo-alpha-sialidase [Aurantibacter crassamenti]